MPKEKLVAIGVSSILAYCFYRWNRVSAVKESNSKSAWDSQKEDIEHISLCNKSQPTESGVSSGISDSQKEDIEHISLCNKDQPTESGVSSGISDSQKEDIEHISLCNKDQPTESGVSSGISDSQTHHNSHNSLLPESKPENFDDSLLDNRSQRGNNSGGDNNYLDNASQHLDCLNTVSCGSDIETLIGDDNDDGDDGDGGDDDGDDGDLVTDACHSLSENQSHSRNKNDGRSGTELCNTDKYLKGSDHDLFYDGAVLCAEDDRKVAVQFISHMQEEMADLNICLYEDLATGKPVLDFTAKLFETCRFLFVLVTKNFSDLERFLGEIALAETLTETIKRYRVIPVLLESECHITELSPIIPLQYYDYIKDSKDTTYIRGFKKLINGGRRKYLTDQETQEEEAVSMSNQDSLDVLETDTAPLSPSRKHIDQYEMLSQDTEPITLQQFNTCSQLNTPPLDHDSDSINTCHKHSLSFGINTCHKHSLSFGRIEGSNVNLVNKQEFQKTVQRSKSSLGNNVSMSEYCSDTKLLYSPESYKQMTETSSELNKITTQEYKQSQKFSSELNKITLQESQQTVHSLESGFEEPKSQSLGKKTSLGFVEPESQLISGDFHNINIQESERSDLSDSCNLSYNNTGERNSLSDLPSSSCNLSCGLECSQVVDESAVISETGKQFSVAMTTDMGVEEHHSDGVILYAEDDRGTAIDFINDIETELPDLNVKLLLYEELQQGPILRQRLFHQCNYVFILVTEHFKQSDIERFQGEIALIESLSDPIKNCRVIPVVIGDQYNVPELKPLIPLKYGKYREAKFKNKKDHVFIRMCKLLVENGRTNINQ